MITYPNAKINIGLWVLRKREDGYHDIETLFAPCPELYDILEINPCENISHFRIELSDGSPAPWPVEKDLCTRAYELLRQDFDLPPVSLQLKKHIPFGAGLGGGSSDAAFTLKMLNQIFCLRLSDEDLASYAAKLGSDCPFFIHNRYMIGTGRGEILKDCELDLSDYEIRVVVPEGISVSTAEAYAGITPQKRAISLEKLLKEPVERWKNTVWNDFEAPVFKKYTLLEEKKRELYDSGAVFASLSGSGSALYGIFKLDI